MGVRVTCLLGVLLFGAAAFAQGTVPVFTVPTGQGVWTLAGNAPQTARTTTLDTMLVPVTLRFAGGRTLSAAGDARLLAQSPLFRGFDGTPDGQFGDALLRAALPGAPAWHTRLSQPAVRALTVEVPAAYGYLLTDRPTGRELGVVDSDWLEKQVFAQIGRPNNKLVLAVTHNTTFYADGDATICCTWGTHGVDPGTGTSFVLSTYLDTAAPIVSDADVQPLSQQLGEFLLDPLHDPSLYGRDETRTGNVTPPWRRPFAAGCGGPGVGSSYFLLEPADTNRRNNIPSAPGFVEHSGGRSWHLENIALPAWYRSGFRNSGIYSFPEVHLLAAAAQPCARRPFADDAAGAMPPTATPAPNPKNTSGHALIGYWTGHNGFALTQIAPQWDVMIVAFAPPAAHGVMTFTPPAGTTPEEFKAQVAALKRQGRMVLISLGGGGAFFHLDGPEDTKNFVDSLEQIISTYGFDGVDIDFETPSLVLDAGDTDYRHPKTVSTVQLIAGLRALHDHFGSSFRISLVPEGPQIPGGLPVYGGQFGAYLPLVYGLRDILTFVDVQDYNTPPLEGLDGHIYQLGSVDYDAAMTELLLRGFAADGDAHEIFAPVPASKVAVGFLAGVATPAHMQQAIRWLITGVAPAGSAYTLQTPGGYPQMLGAMLWTIDADRHDNYAISNTVGPELHAIRAQ